MFSVLWNHEGVRGTPRIRESLEEACAVMSRFVTLGFENVRVAECDARGNVLRFLKIEELPLVKEIEVAR